MTTRRKKSDVRGFLRGVSDEELLWRLPEAPATMQRRIALELGRRRCRAASDQLVQLLDSPDPHVRAAAAEAVGEIGEACAAPSLVKLLLDPEQPPEVRDTCAYACGRIGAEELQTVRALLSALADPAPSVRVCAVAALAAIGGATAYDRIRYASEPERNPDVKAAMRLALRHLPKPHAPTFVGEPVEAVCVVAFKTIHLRKAATLPSGMSGSPRQVAKKFPRATHLSGYLGADLALESANPSPPSCAALEALPS